MLQHSNVNLKHFYLDFYAILQKGGTFVLFRILKYMSCILLQYTIMHSRCNFITMSGKSNNNHKLKRLKTYHVLKKSYLENDIYYNRGTFNNLDLRNIFIRIG